MTSQPPEGSRTTAIDALETFGLSTYAAETYLALAEHGSLTARQVSERTHVPRTRVYDAVEELEDLEIVESETGSPQEFTALNLRRTSRRLGKEYDRRSAMLTLALLDIDELESERVTLDSVAEAVDSDLDFEELFETVQHGLSEVRLFRLTGGDGEELTAVYLPGDDGADPELRLFSDFAEDAAADD